VAGVMQKSLLGLVQLARGEEAAALVTLAKATTDEDTMPIAFGPPVIVKPSHEVYGEVLLSLGRHQEAMAEFEKALERAPRRSLSLAGLARASLKAGNMETVERACAELGMIYSGADNKSARAGVCAAQPSGEAISAK
jgi:predicted Zn-dependent protease